MELEEIVVGSTRVQLEEFRESIIWKDIVRELDAWLMGLEREVEIMVENAANDNPSTANVCMHIGHIYGRKKAVEYMKAIPSVLIGFIDDKKANKDREED